MDNLEEEKVEKETLETTKDSENNKTPDPREETTEEESNVKEIKPEKKEEVDFKSKYYYLAAEMDNMKKRFSREKENIIKYGSEKILSSVIEVVDDFDRTLSALQDEKEEKIVNIISGVDMVRNKLLDCLTKSGLEPIDSMGKIFDPNFHEAMAMQPAEGKKEQEIITEFQRGYMLNGRLLRAAKVIIAKND